MTRTILLALICMANATFAYADDGLRDLCPDRPGKGTSECTVDAGHFQLEVDAFDVTFQRAGGATTQAYILADPTLKYGVTDNLDIEASLAPVEIIRTHDATGTDTETGVGDLFLRTKFNIAGNDGGDFGLAIEPFLKIPTARREFGNGDVEGGGMDRPPRLSWRHRPAIDRLRPDARPGRAFRAR